MQKFFGFASTDKSADQKRNSNSHYQIMENEHAVATGDDATYNPYTAASDAFHTPTVQKPAGIGLSEAGKGEISNIEKLYNKVLSNLMPSSSFHDYSGIFNV
jgi:hypothetical protein